GAARGDGSSLGDRTLSGRLGEAGVSNAVDGVLEEILGASGSSSRLASTIRTPTAAAAIQPHGTDFFDGASAGNGGVASRFVSAAAGRRADRGSGGGSSGSGGGSSACGERVARPVESGRLGISVSSENRSPSP